MHRTSIVSKWLVSPVVFTAMVATIVVPFPQSSFLTQVNAADPAINEQAVAYTDGLSAAFRQATAMVQPTVVSVTSEKELRISGGSRGDLSQVPEEFRRFFGDDFDRFFNQPVPEQRGFQRGFGSGVIVSHDGYILTNNHVVAGADEVRVKLQDGSTHQAKVVGTDPKTEVA